MTRKEQFSRAVCLCLALSVLTGGPVFAADPATEIAASESETVIMEESESGIYTFEAEINAVAYPKDAQEQNSEVSQASIEVIATLSGEYNEKKGTLDVTVLLVPTVADTFNSASGTISYVTSEGSMSLTQVSEDAGLLPNITMELSHTFHWVYMLDDGTITISTEGEFDMQLYAGYFFGSTVIEAPAYEG